MKFLICIKKEFLEFLKNKKWFALFVIFLFGNFILVNKGIQNLSLYQGVFLSVLIFQFIFDVTKNDFTTGGMIFLLNIKTSFISILVSKFFLALVIYGLFLISSTLGGGISALAILRLFLLVIFVTFLSYFVTILTKGNDIFSLIITLVLGVYSMYLPTILAIICSFVVCGFIYSIFNSKYFRNLL